MTGFSKKKANLRLSAVMLATAYAGLACAVQAQEAAPPSAREQSGLETVARDDGSIIVTARRYVPLGSQSASKSDIPLIETPQSVSVITRDQIDLLNFIDGQQAVRYTSGVFGENYGPDLRYDFITVRGFTPKQYIDGLAAPISTTIYSVGVDLYAFESMDILKGPASVLYGNAPPGGIYNQTSRRASQEFDGELAVKYGTDDYKQIAGTVTGAASEDLAVRITALYRDRDSERDFVNARRLLAAPTATWNIGSNTTLTGLAYYQYDKIVGDTNGFLPVYGTLLPNPNGRIPRSTNLGDPGNVSYRRQFAAGYAFEHDFGGVTFSSNAKWNEYKETAPKGVYGGGGLTNITDPTLPSYYRTVGRYNFTYYEKVRAFVADNRLKASFATGGIEHKLLAGVDYRSVTNHALFGFFFDPAPIDLYNPVYTPISTPTTLYPSPFNNQRLRQTGVYVQDQIALGNLYVTVGGRQDWVKVDNRNTDTSTKQDKFTWRAGANYVFGSGIAPYVSYARSFEPVLGVDQLTNQPFKPSLGEQWEGGIKFDARGLPSDIKMFVTASVFDIKQTNVVSTSPSVTPVFGTQSGEVEVYGGEIEFVARIREQISINGSYSYTHSEVTENANEPSQVGEPLPTTPKHKLSLFANYSVQRGALAGLGLGFGGRYHSRSAGSLPGAFNPIVYQGESSTLFDAIISYDTPDWRFAINGSNIFDKVYVARCAGPAGCNYGAGRQVIGTVTAKF